MIEKKLVEKEVEVTKVEKRVIEVYHYDGKDYYETNDLQEAIVKKMACIFNEFLNFSADSCHLVNYTKLDILKRNLRWSGHAERVFGGDEIDELIDQLKELKSVYSQVSA